jgi:hypothetical protein
LQEKYQIGRRFNTFKKVREQFSGGRTQNEFSPKISTRPDENMMIDDKDLTDRRPLESHCLQTKIVAVCNSGTSGAILVAVFSVCSW